MLPFTHEELEKEVELGYIYKRQADHASNLFIYNYSPAAQYESRWNSVTLNCRGLILDDQFNIVARPFKKFFNYAEHDSDALPDIPVGESFEVYEKLDGSLGIIYFDPALNKWNIATRGSFASDQAKVACDMLHSVYVNSLYRLQRGVTYLVEIIYPENRIVVDYGEQRELVLLGAVENATGQEIPLDKLQLGFKKAEIYRDYDLDQILLDAKAPQSNFEGWVIKFESGMRVKVKLDDYVRVHRVATGLTKLRIWDIMQSGADVRDYISELPDELYRYAEKLIEELQNDYALIEAKYLDHFASLDLSGDRKSQALEIQRASKKSGLNASLLFRILDGKSRSEMIWKLLRPSGN